MNERHAEHFSQIDGFGEMERLCNQRPDQRAMTRIRIGADPVKTVTQELMRVTSCALRHDLLVTVVVDPEATVEQYSVMVLLNGDAPDLSRFAADMRAARAR